MKNTEYVFYDDTDVTTQYNNMRDDLFDIYFHDYEWASKNDVPDDMIWKQIGIENDDDYHYMKIALQKVIDGNYFIVKGTCGRWNGRQECGKFIRSVIELFDGLRHLDYLKIYEKNGHFYIEGSHHDGSDCYELKQLTKKGVEYANKHYFAHDKQLHSTIFNNNLFSALPRFYNKLYGEVYG